MSMFGDYKSYKKYEPAYPEWKNNRDKLEAKRMAYLEKHPELINQEDIQRGEVLLRTIDIMDEYSQKKAENMEAATEPVISMGLEFALVGGGALGVFLGSFKPIGSFFARIVKKGSKYKKYIGMGVPGVIGLVISSIAAFPLMAWGAKAEVGASRKGRFEAMREELNNPNGFAVLTPEQLDEANKIAGSIVLEEDKKKKVTEQFAKSFNAIKDMAVDSKEYKIQKKNFEKELEKDENTLDKELTPKEIENAKKDQQLLTKLVEKIDIASQDYGENSELATQGCIATIGGLYLAAEGFVNALNLKSKDKISTIIKGVSIALFAILGLISAQVNKQASRVGRYKVKQELMQNPNNFVYVSDEQANTIKDAEVQKRKKDNIFVFLYKALKNNKEYEKYKKTVGKEERRFNKAVEQLKLSEEQLNDAKRLQKNTFRTFNKIDNNSQKYAESIEALGQSIAYPINMIFSFGAVAIASPYLFESFKSKAEQAKNLTKYIGIIMLSTIPAIIINALITKEQKKASRIADMNAIEELKDYRKFR